MEGKIYSLTSPALTGCYIGFTTKDKSDVLKKYEAFYPEAKIDYFETFQNGWFLEKAFHLLYGPSSAYKKCDGTPSYIYKFNTSKQVDACITAVRASIENDEIVKTKIVTLATELANYFEDLHSVPNRVLLRLLRLDEESELLEITESKGGFSRAMNIIEARLDYLHVYLDQ